LDMYRNFFKRLFDIVISLIGLPFLVFLYIPISILIKLEDGGPVFFNDTRLGRNGISFIMFKFRSMKMNSPDIRNADGSTYNGENDPRVTKVGKILRKTSIDELPQFINVLLGNMSFVGPRPNLADTPISEFDAVRMKRIIVRPGVTGYSQAFFRNSITQEEKFANDCYYIDNITFLFDVKILCKTVMSVIRHEKIFVEQQDQKHN
jgi:undecaprenyl phosphate N,N'-diacetylbacillosamine 1-phosphate transferase